MRKKDSSKIEDIRKMAESNLFVFACLVNPHRIYGEIHEDVFNFWGRPQKEDQLLLLPRGHQKSHTVATWCAWWITKHPETTIVYVSATEPLALNQLSAIKNILTSDTYRRYWPEMVKPEEAKREEWNVKSIKVDHPARKVEGVRDSTVAAKSIDGNTTGLHGDVVVFDDIVVPDNAYTVIGRTSVKAGYSQLSSVLNPGGITKVCGTRYHADDIYNTMVSMEVEEYDAEGNIIGSTPVFQVMQEEVEIDGVFLWPRSQHPSSKKWHGFDNKELAKIRAKYFAAGERIQYYAQYYNNPNAGNVDDEQVRFHYYDRRHLSEADGVWYFHGKPLSIYMGGDLAFTNSPTADYTAFAVVGVTADWEVLILDLDQFRTDSYQRIYDSVSVMYHKWKPKKLRIESDGGANLVVEHIKKEARKAGFLMIVEGKKAQGEKVERFHMIVAPRYKTDSVYHYKGGIISEYEEQVELPRPAHDDLRDAVSIAVEIAQPASHRRSKGQDESRGKIISINNRFGGRVR